MTTNFVSHAKEDATCAEQIRQDLEAKGYSTWREPGYPGPTDFSYPHMIENAILGSAIVVLVWSTSAAESEWVERHTLFAQRLKKPIIPVVLDGTSLPNTLIVDTTITSQAPCTDAVAQLLPHLPPADSTDPLIKLSEQAAHEFNRIRKEATDQAAGMLERGEHREAVLAILEYLARNDLMMGVREKAQEVLEADAKRAAAPSPFLHPGDSRHIFAVRCKECGHITYFDKRRVCPAQAHVVRKITQRGGAELDEMELPCEQCGHKMPTHVDCGGYR